ncbi:MoxR family ATPase, partial [candidate division WOR-3 bacterium]|nr:MoxR family ATPase [candidate division WOR-3 bacterium]
MDYTEGVDISVINETAQKESAFVQKLFAEIGKAIIGQKYLIERQLICLLTDGHLLVEGVPGLAKTYSIRTLASAIDAAYRRIQFTPDLLPADITGTEIYDQRKGTFVPKTGPIFANLVLADEINRAPPKVQSALLEAMQEREVTIGEKTFKLPDPFLVLATQNPIEQEGTYPLPEAQVDRFKLKAKITYPSYEEERQIMEQQTSQTLPEIKPVVTLNDLKRVKGFLHQVYVDEKIKKYILDIVFATREPENFNIGDIKPYIRFGASPRASIYLLETARAHAFLERRGFVIPEDVKDMAMDVLRHRIILTYE